MTSRLIHTQAYDVYVLTVTFQWNEEEGITAGTTLRLHLNAVETVFFGKLDVQLNLISIVKLSIKSPEKNG